MTGQVQEFRIADEPQAQSTRELLAKFAFCLSVLTGTSYFIAWTLINNAGQLMVTVGNMDNCPSSGSSSYSDGSDNGVTTISCEELRKMNPTQNWPAQPVDGCVDGVNYQRTVASLLNNRCTPELMKQCATILANAFFSGSRATPYSKFGEFVNAYGVFCDKDTSAWIAPLFILAVGVTLAMTGLSAYYGKRLWSRACGSEVDTSYRAVPGLTPA